jgi:hypothetical protein
VLEAQLHELELGAATAETPVEQEVIQAMAAVAL